VKIKIVKNIATVKRNVIMKKIIMDIAMNNHVCVNVVVNAEAIAR